MNFLFVAIALLGAGTVAACASRGSEREPRAAATTATTPAAATTPASSTTTTVTPAPTTPAPTLPPTAAPPTTTLPPATAAPEPAFTFSASELSDDVIARMVPTSWREGCPVPLADLRYLEVSYWGFDGAVHTGELVVHTDAVAVMEDVFATLFAARFPIASMRLVDDFGGGDFTSIEADNTSAFNCRAATGSSNWSQHAYGRAIDINPIENPYVDDGETEHLASVPFLDRDDVRPGMIVEGDVVVSAFDAHGWGWGGRWTSVQDYQHFSATGR